MYEYIHTCGEIAFYLDHKPVKGEVIKPESITMLDGRHPLRGGRAICGSCGMGVEGFILKNVKKA